MKYPCQAPFGSVQIKASQWAGGLDGTGHDGATFTVYSNYRAGRPPSPPGSDCAGDWEKRADGTTLWGLAYQCTELAVRVADAEWGTGTWAAWTNAGWDGAAADMKAPGLRLGLAWTGNGTGSLPAPGDLMIWKRSSPKDPGHVAVVSAVTSTAVTFVGENQGPGMVTLPVSGTYVENKVGGKEWKKNSSILGWLSHGHTPQSWTTSEASMPPGFAQLYPDEIGRMVCPSASACVAFSDYADTYGDGQGVLFTGSGTSWTTTQAPVPADASRGHGYGTAAIRSVACPAPSTCVASGYYVQTSGATQGLLLSGSGTSWTPIKAPLPANASATYPNAILNGVACPSTTACVATGFYADSSDNYHGVILHGSGTSWTAAKAPAPADAARHPGVQLGYVACPSTTSCVATGTYLDASGHYQGMLLSGSGTSWTAIKAPMPAKAAPDPDIRFLSLACPSTTACVIAGDYADASTSTIQGLLLTGSGTSWTAIKAPLPASAGPGTEGLEATVFSVTCPTTSTCFAAGYYNDTSGHSQGLLLAGAGSAWTPARAPVPANGSTHLPAGLNSIACPSVSTCVASGYYDSGSGDVPRRGLLLTASGARWKATEAPLPANSSAKPSAFVASVACPSSAECSALGWYVDTSGQLQLMLLTGPG